MYTYSHSYAQACADFPSTSSSIIQHHGLDTEEFNLLQAKVKNNIIFRYRVQNNINKLHKEVLENKPKINAK